MKILKNIISAITLFIFILSLTIIVNVSVAIKNNKVPNLFGYSYMTVTTGSMEPVLKINDLIVVKRRTTYKVNDIVTFYYDVNNDGINDVVTHKIVAINGDIVTTYGVNNPITKTETIQMKNIVGKVIYQSTFLGNILSHKVVTNKIYILSLIIIILLIFIVFQIIKIIKLSKVKEDS